MEGHKGKELVQVISFGKEFYNVKDEDCLVDFVTNIEKTNPEF